MKATFRKSDLAEAVTLAAGIAPKRTGPPITAYLTIAKSDDAEVAITGMDLDVGSITSTVPCSIADDSTGVIKAADLVRVLKGIKDRRALVTITADAIGNATIECDGIVIPLATTLTSLDVPMAIPPSFDIAKPHHQVDAAVLAKLIDRTLFAAAKESVRYAITGVLWELHATMPTMRLVATDIKRLAIADGPATPTDAHSGAGVVPTAVMAKLRKMLKAGTVKVQFDWPDNIAPTAMRIVVGTTSIYAKLVQGRFPPYRDVVPDTTAKTFRRVIVDRQSLLDRCRALSKVVSADDDDDDRGVVFRFAGSTITMTHHQASAQARMLAGGIEGEITVCIDPTFLADPLAILEGEHARLHLQPQSCCVLENSDDFTYCFMPRAM